MTTVLILALIFLCAPLSFRLTNVAGIVSRVIAPAPDPRSILEFAKTIKVPDERGGDRPPLPYCYWEHPPHMAFLQAFASGKYMTFTVLGPVQDGKTLVTLVVGILYCLIELRQSVVFGTTDNNLLSKTWSGKIRQCFIDSGYAHLLADGGLGTGKIPADGDIQIKTGAHIYFIGAGGTNQSAQASVTVRFVFKDEMDGIKPFMSQLMDSRTEAFDMDGRITGTSTVKKARGSVTLAKLAESTRCRVQYACPFCSCFQTWTWEQITSDYTSDDSATQEARINCRECHAALTEADRRRMIRNGWREVSELPDGTYTTEITRSMSYGMRWWAAESPRKSLQKICFLYRRALIAREKHNDHSDMRKFFHDILTLPYEDDADDMGTELDAGLLGQIAARSTYRKGEIPIEAKVVCVAQDCQLRSHFWIAVAFWKVDDAIHFAIIDWGQIAVCGDSETPEPHQRAAVLDQVAAIARKGWMVQGRGGYMPATYCAVDIGFKPGEIRPWVADHRREWLSIRGAGMDLVVKMKGTKAGSKVVDIGGALEVRESEGFADRMTGWIDVTALGDDVATAWRSGLGHLPQDIDPKLESSLLGTRREPEGWVQVHRRHDYWDGLLYALARAHQFFVAPTRPPRQIGQVGSALN